MKILATRIAKELKIAKRCAVYEPELGGVWPDAEKREAQIASFAKKHGWRLRHCRHGFCATVFKIRAIMKILAGPIRRELQLQAGKYGHCAVYEDELQRVWPINEENRKAKIEQFANQNGFRLVYYKPGLCAIFEEQ